MGDLIYPRYILVCRDKVTLEVVKLYDISDPVNVTLLQAHLLKERTEWEQRCAQDKKYMKRDVISIPESILRSNIAKSTTTTISNCTVVRA
jgi:hypothetical protein